MLLLAAVVAGGCSSSWSSDEINARVLDASTGKPVSGVIVEVNWQLSGMEGYPSGQLAVFETVTDDSGRFHIPAWGPRKVSAWVTVYGDQPVARILKRGYEPLIVYEQINDPGENSMRARSHMRPEISGKDLMLVPVREGSLNDYAQKVDRLWSSVVTAFVTTRCDRKQVPKLFAELKALKDMFDEAGVHTLLSSQEKLCR